MLTVLAALLPPEAATVVAVASMAVAAIAPAVYSWIVWRRESGRPGRRGSPPYA
jgi:hypothetical protein